MTIKASRASCTVVASMVRHATHHDLFLGIGYAAVLADQADLFFVKVHCRASVSQIFAMRKRKEREREEIY